MEKLILVVGQAGTGKTTWLINKIKDLVSSINLDENQSILAITRMHGARRRIKTKLGEACPEIPCTVTTIDSFALTILNRWRSSLAHSKPIISTKEKSDFDHTIFGIEADFERVLISATKILKKAIAAKVIGRSYPIVVIDEFQDCHGPMLEFIKVLSSCSNLIIAADDFQLLDSNISGCPAIEWVQEMEKKGAAEIVKLATCHRTDVKAILNTAQALRENISVGEPSVAMISCPKEGIAAWKIIEPLFFSKNKWTGSTALICPSKDPAIEKIINSCNTQLKKKGRSPIIWNEEHSQDIERASIQASIKAKKENKSSGKSDYAVEHVLERSRKFAKLKGMETASDELVERHIDFYIHQKRAYHPAAPRRTITTVHKAKNREFDNVFILWTYKIPADAMQQRRLFYNAVTRSRKNCVILLWGAASRVKIEPTLKLLGPVLAAFPKKQKK